MSFIPLLDLLNKVDLLLHFAESTLKFAKQLKPLIEQASSEDDGNESSTLPYAGCEEGFDEEEGEDHNEKKRKKDDL